MSKITVEITIGMTPMIVEVSTPEQLTKGQVERFVRQGIHNIMSKLIMTGAYTLSKNEKA